MRHDEIEALLGSAPDRTLDGLEAAIWRGVAERAEAGRRIRAAGTLQGGALLIVLLASLSWGAMRAKSLGETRDLRVFSPRMVLAPSTRLTGVEG